MKKLIAFLLVLCLAAAVVPAFAAPAGEAEDDRLIHSGTVIDTDGSDGYTGDYVVIYNPSSSTTSGATTGSLAGKIETTIEQNTRPSFKEVLEMNPNYNPDKPYIIDVDSEVEANTPADVPEAVETKASYPVGTTKNFTIYNYSPGGTSVQFKVLYIGNHCRIWTVTNSAYYPLDGIDTSYAAIAAAEFDQKFELMQVAYGNFRDSNNDGLVNIMFYNIDDGWQPGQGYVAGYFWSSDYSYNSLPMIHIDTYPGIQYTNTSGQTITHLDDCYGTLVHEFQHCINYNVTGGMHSWLNECFSGSAEELCYPGSGLFSRIQSWHNYTWTSRDELYDPPAEYAYSTDIKLNKGGSLAYWNNNDEMDDLLNRYAGVMFFSQFLYSKSGTTTIYKSIMDRCSGSSVSNSLTALTSGTGWSLETIWRDYAISLVANDYEAGYGFRMNEGYDPAEYYDLETLYSLLSPVIYNSTSAASVQGGGFIVIKPLNGVYTPPSGASSTLRYAGITVTPQETYEVTAVSNNNAYGTVSVDGYKITAAPAAGYYVESCTLVSGDATWTINGNTINVVPTSDCTIRVNFAPKPQYTVNFVACGASEGSQTAYANDAITLPVTESVNPEGWTFIGWLGNQLEETTTRPTFYAPGAAYTVTGNATLYALYNRTEATGGETVYEQTTELEVGGKYAITMGNYAVGNTIYNTSVNHYVTSQSVTINGNYLTVASSVNINSILYEIESGTAAAGYVFKNVANGKYLTLGSDEYLIVGDTPLAWLWANGDLNNQIDSEGYYYLSRASNSTYFTTSKNTQGTVVMYREVSAEVNYYTTDPVVAQPTYYTVTFKDWDGTVLKTEEVLEGAAATAPANPTREGYTFTGWDTAFDNVQSDLVVTAQYTINSYTVTFKDWDGTVLKTETVNYGGAATAPANPTREGYTFTGWDVAFNNVTSNLIVTAQYQINTYTVTFKDWDGTVLKTETVNYGGAATAPADPTREGYTFIGWDVAFNYVTSNLVVTALYEENAQPGNLPGDANADGSITSADLSALFAYVMNAGSLTEQGLLNADVNGDGVINTLDVTLLAQLIFGA